MKTFNKVGASLAAIAAAGITLTGCGSGSSTSAKTDSESCGFAFIMQDPISSSTAEQTIVRGLDNAQKEHDVTIDVIDGTAIAAVADNLRSAAARGCYEAIGVPFFANGDAVTQVASEYPEQAFYIAGGVAEGANVTSFNAANEEGTYVAGAMAAAMTKSGTIGVIIGDDSPSLRRYSDGFAAGAASVDPSTKVITTAVGSFTDPAKAGSIATNQASKGADIIYSAAGSNLQVYALGAQNGYRTIASDLTDWASVRATNPALAFIAAPTEDKLNSSIIAAYVNGDVPGGETRELGLKDGIFDIPYITGVASNDFEIPQVVVDAGTTAYEYIRGGGAATK
ncbi:BMP family lipoprotein [Rhodococcus globerulus]|uniref:BMP family ABC transporter substrate-binding protein n=1 Tax=Rhodococcus globerulus TaxID=33008 RepID=A0ABU4C320_RHOGO|nr:BMP family ABC transporter substrate-binding protein [Rhodococcus globerulus]MDV6270814.1 BMP family ABC transporter substrate-binding protein [Rhodococcus globerulus]